MPARGGSFPRSSANRGAWPGLLRALLSGYEETLPLSGAKRRAIFPTLCTIELIFMAFSLDHRQPDAARCNQDVLFWLHNNRSGIADSP